LFGTNCSTAKAQPPNFVLILADDLGWSDLGCYGSDFHESPNLDHLAASGMQFTAAYAACPVCSPTRASIMTGKYPARVGITDYIPGLSKEDTKLLTPEDMHQLPYAEVTIAEALKEAGYQTFIAGKWHLGDEDEFGPDKQGFDVVHTKSTLGYRRGYYKDPKDPESEYLTDRLTDECIAYLKEVGAQAEPRPFFLYLSSHNPHTPVQPHPRHIEKFRRKLETMKFPDGPRLAKERNGNTRLYQDNAEFASMVYALDENVGRLLATLEEQGFTDNTVVIFMSDNGGLCTHSNPRGGSTSNRPLRSGKGWCYEGGVRVPMIVRAPGVTQPGSECGEPVISTDFYPTILELAGLPLRGEQHVDGISLAPLLKGGDALPRAAIYWHYPHYHGSTWAPGAAVRARDWKLIEFYEEQTAELYNLADDIGERNNLAVEMPEKAEELRAMLRDWQQSVGAKMPVPNPDYKPET
jgi:arylsulfatase A-like enzyme